MVMEVILGGKPLQRHAPAHAPVTDSCSHQAADTAAAAAMGAAAMGAARGAARGQGCRRSVIGHLLRTSRRTSTRWRACGVRVRSTLVPSTCGESAVQARSRALPGVPRSIRRSRRGRRSSSTNSAPKNRSLSRGATPRSPARRSRRARSPTTS